jgi:hypothetical protein
MLIIAAMLKYRSCRMYVDKLSLGYWRRKRLKKLSRNQTQSELII